MEEYEHQVSEPIPLIGLMGGLKSDAQEHLTAMGAEGWELVSTTPGSRGNADAADCVYFWKRRSAFFAASVLQLMEKTAHNLEQQTELLQKLVDKR
jgi:hypothetical protein